MALTGYLHSMYAESLSEFGTPRKLPHSGAWILERQIPGFTWRDAISCYPFFVCRDQSQIDLDLAELSNELISFTAVTDPFGAYTMASLQQCFKDVVRPFKEHFVIDLSRSIDSFIHPHHLRNARKALRDVQVEMCEPPIDFLEDWSHLYDHLIEKHNITGISAFSKSAFAKQLQVPGIVAFRAIYDNKTIGMVLWYMQNEVGYYHLGAYSQVGYELSSSFSIFKTSIEHFAGKLRWLGLGAGAGIAGSATDGLTRFKSGWSTQTRTTYLCGRIFDHLKYSEITQRTGKTSTNYFPAYREGEFRVKGEANVH